MRLAVDFFGTLFDAETALERFCEAHPELLDRTRQLDRKLLRAEHYEEILRYGNLLESAPRHTYCYYTDHPNVPLELIRKWLARRNQPSAPVLRLDRTAPLQYANLFHEEKLSAFVDDNPPFGLAHFPEVVVWVPTRPWNRFRLRGAAWVRLTDTIRNYEDSILKHGRS